MQLGLPFDDLTPAVSAPPDDVFYFVRHKLARRYWIRVDGDGRVRVTIPRGGSRREAGAFAQRHRDWIRNQRARLRIVPRDPSAVRALQALGRRALPARLEQLAEEHGLTVSRVTVRNQRSRWGSCGRDGHISLNWRLMLMPEWVRDYVLIHELMHLKRLDHSRGYWQLVADACPAYQDAQRWLRAHGPSLR
jgi:hypothetical protein